MILTEKKNLLVTNLTFRKKDLIVLKDIAWLIIHLESMMVPMKD